MDDLVKMFAKMIKAGKAAGSSLDDVMKVAKKAHPEGFNSKVFKGLWSKTDEVVKPTTKKAKVVEELTDVEKATEPAMTMGKSKPKTPKVEPAGIKNEVDVAKETASADKWKEAFQADRLNTAKQSYVGKIKKYVPVKGAPFRSFKKSQTYGMLVKDASTGQEEYHLMRDGLFRTDWKSKVVNGEPTAPIRMPPSTPSTPASTAKKTLPKGKDRQAIEAWLKKNKVPLIAGGAGVAAGAILAGD